jgi:site-specific DNA recombinase
LRVTREESLINGLSLPAQLQGCTAYVERAGIGPIKIFEESKAIGADIPFRNRPACRELIEAIENGCVRHLVIRDLDRFCRDVVLSAELLELLRRYKVQLHTWSGPVSLKSASDRFSYRVRSAASELEKDTVSDRVKLAKRQAVIQGRWPGGPPPMGFRTQAWHRRILIRSGVDPDTATIQACTEYPIARALYIYEPEAEIVREIYRLSEAGLGSRRIVGELNRRGYRTRENCFWSSERLSRTMANPAGAGYLHYDDDTEDRSTPLHRRKQFKGRHSAIITIEQWRHAMRRREMNKLPGRRNGDKTSANRQYILSGVLLCQCGSPMRGKSLAAKKAGRYVCCKAKYYGKTTVNGCDKKRTTINCERVHAVFLPKLQEMLAVPDLVDRVYRATLQLAANAKKHKQEAHSLTDLLAKAEKQLGIWYKRHDEASEPDEQEAAWRRVVELTAEKKKLQKAIEEQSKLGVDPSRITHQQIAEYLGSMTKLIEKFAPDEARGFVRSLADHHGLRVQMIEPERMRIELTIRTPGSLEGGVPVVAEVGVPLDKIGAWLAENQGKAKCELCGEQIPVLRRHFWLGFPRRHRSCHSRELMRLRNHRKDGLLSQADLARRFKVGDSTIGRWVASGKLPPPDKKERGTKLWKPGTVAKINP